jgi:UDP-N-acetylmuramate: L-alanyl-gamma-D-glutamyl-meso-diaminopimelate ligase
MHIHFIAIGGSAMHNLAIALHKKGYRVTGSDDEIFEPSRSRLEKYGLLPATQGWDIETISAHIDVIILGMHARVDNPELLRAQELGLKIYSYPEYLYEQTKHKTRVVIGGSHGKTTTTSMVMHVLKYHGIDFDYMVGANIEGFETMVGLNNTSEIAVFEGDEYLSSPIDRRPKFLHYHPNIALITGIAWDHINVFPTFEGYVEQFELFAHSIESNGCLVWFNGDPLLHPIAAKLNPTVGSLPYRSLPFKVTDNITIAFTPDGELGLQVFGEHNLQNMAGAKLVCEQLGIDEKRFFEAIASFKGSSRRLEMVSSDASTTVYFDFAHSPSKLMATTTAVKEQFSTRGLVAVMELHTFSSLKKEFLPQYNGCMDAADTAYVYFDPHTVEHKKLEMITPEMVEQAFGNKVKVFTNADRLFDELRCMNWENRNLLIMSSGNFSGKDVKAFGREVIDKKFIT